MKTISLHVSEEAYSEIKSIAARQDRPVAAVIREAMDAYLESARRTGPSVLELKGHRCGPLREDWTRSELVGEMLDREPES